MSVSTFFTQTLGVVRTSESRDAIGGVTTGVATTTNVLGYIEPTTGQEELVNRNTPIGEWVAFLPVDTDVTAQDRITYDGHTFDIDSVEPFHHPTLNGLDHIRLRLREVT